MSLIDDARAGISQPNVAPPAPPLPPALNLPQAPSAVKMVCVFCGSTPVANVTFRQHIGLVLMMRRLAQSGPFCRTCGIAVFRRLTARTLVTGWWGYASFFMTPYTLIANLINRRKVARLAPPQFPFAGRQPISPGRPVYLRWQFIGVLLPVAIVVIAIAATGGDSGSTSSTTDTVGECVASVNGTTQMQVVDCDQPHDGRVTAIVTNADNCPDNTTWALFADDNASTLCVATAFD